jgi:phenylacetate-coenzyme A ligase PaaK-like adenylate-forming protein
MESIYGRSGDVITTPSGNHLIVHFFTGILEHFPEIDSFQVVQKSDNTLLLKIQPYNEIDAFTINEIVRMLMEKGCDDMNIETEIVPSIPLSPMGKHRFIINETNIKHEKQPN